MRKATLALVFFSLAGTTPGWAQQRQQSIPPESVAEIPPSQGGKSLSAEIASLKPEVGILEFTDATGGVGGGDKTIKGPFLAGRPPLWAPGPSG